MRYRLNDTSWVLIFDWDAHKFEFRPEVAKWFADSIGYAPKIHAVGYDYSTGVHFHIELEFKQRDDIIMFQLYGNH